MDENKQEDNKKTNQDILKWIIIGLAGFGAVVLIFGMGIFVGGAKAKFSYRWAESYHKNFAGPRSGFFGDWKSFPRGDLIEGHGAFGEIIELNDTGFVIRGRGDVEKVIVITEDVVIKKGRKTIKDGLQVGDQVIIIGSPNDDGQIEAKLIRVFAGEEVSMLRRPRHNFF